MKNFLNPNNWGIVKVYRDFENYADWIRTIKREEKRSHEKSYYQLNYSEESDKEDAKTVP